MYYFCLANCKKPLVLDPDLCYNFDYDKVRSDMVNYLGTHMDKTDFHSCYKNPLLHEGKICKLFGVGNVAELVDIPVNDQNINAFEEKLPRVYFDPVYYRDLKSLETIAGVSRHL